MVSSQSHDDRSHTLDHPTQTSVAVAATATSPSSSSPSSSASSSSWSVASLQEQWNTFQDSQRLERLASCLELDQLLKECRKQQTFNNDNNNNNNNNNTNTNLVQTTDSLESMSPGLRTMKYFGWRGILSQLRPQQSMVAKEDINPTATGSITQQDDDSHDRDHHRKLDAIHRQIQSSCSREQHSVWACRAVATGCGKELASLKRCFEEQHHAYDVLTVPRTNYEGSSNTEGRSDRRTIPCFEEQQVMGSCVTANALQLLERKQQREGRNKESPSPPPSS